MSQIIVIGSGFGGISAATHLARAGYQVTVLEKNKQLGGRASLLEAEGFRWDMGPSWYLMPDIFSQYFEDVGKKVEDYLDLQKLSPSYRVFFKDTDKVADVYDELKKNAEIFEKLEPGSMKKLDVYLKKAAYQYEVAMREFVPKNYDSFWDFFTWRMLTEGMKLNIFTKLDKYVARYFKTPEMQKIMQYPLVFLGTAPSDAPAMYNIMSWVDFGMGVYYPQGGIRSVIEALVTIAESEGVVFKTEQEVTAINVTDGAVNGVTTQDGLFHKAEKVISNADMHWTETKLLDTQRQTYPESYREKKKLAPSAFILYLGVKGKVANLQHHTLLFSEDRKKNFDEIFDQKIVPTDPSMYICCPSKTDQTCAPKGHENMFVLVPFPPGVELNEDEQDYYRNKILTTIEETIGEQFVDRIVQEHRFTAKNFRERYNAYQGTALGLAHTFDQTAIFRPNNISKSVKDLYYTGAYTNPGIGMPMCLLSGKLTAQRILGK